MSPFIHFCTSINYPLGDFLAFILLSMFLICCGVYPRHTYSSLVIQFKIHPIFNFIISKCHMILIDGVPFLQHNLFCPCSCLSCYQLLQIANAIIFIALHSHLFTKSIITCYLKHVVVKWALVECGLGVVGCSRNTVVGDDPFIGVEVRFTRAPL